MLGLPVRYRCVLAMLWLCAAVSPVVAQPSIAEVLEGKSLNPSEVDPAIVNFFDRFNKALTEQDTETVAAMFDTQAFCVEVDRCVSDPDAELVSWEIFEKNVLPRLAFDLCRPEVGMAWERIQIKAAKQNADGTYAVTARHWDSEGVASKTTWYLRKGDPDTRLYDINQLDAGLHWSRMIASTVFQGEDFSPETKQAMVLMYDGLLTAAEGEIDLALEQLHEADSDALPDVLRGLIWCTLGTIYYAQDEPERALTHLDRAVVLDSASPLSHYLRAACLNMVARYDEALVEADRYAHSVGVDADVLVVVGDAYVGNEQLSVAIRAYEKALEDDPQHLDALYKMLLWLPDDRKNEFEQYYDKVEQRSVVGKDLAEALADVPDPVSLAALLRLHTRLHPQDEWVKAYAHQEAVAP